jgi:hypothetical protein
MKNNNITYTKDKEFRYEIIVMLGCHFQIKLLLNLRGQPQQKITIIYQDKKKTQKKNSHTMVQVN